MFHQPSYFWFPLPDPVDPVFVPAEPCPELPEFEVEVLAARSAADWARAAKPLDDMSRPALA